MRVCELLKMVTLRHRGRANQPHEALTLRERPSTTSLRQLNDVISHVPMHASLFSKTDCSGLHASHPERIAAPVVLQRHRCHPGTSPLAHFEHIPDAFGIGTVIKCQQLVLSDGLVSGSGNAIAATCNARKLLFACLKAEHQKDLVQALVLCFLVMPQGSMCCFAGPESRVYESIQIRQTGLNTSDFKRPPSPLPCPRPPVKVLGMKI